MIPSIAALDRLCPGADVLLHLFNPRGPTWSRDLEFEVYVREIDHPALQPARLAHCLEELEDLGLIVGWRTPPSERGDDPETLVKLTPDGHAVRSRLRELSRVRSPSDHVVRFDAREVVRRRTAAKGLARRDASPDDVKILRAVRRGRAITPLNVFAALRREDPKGLWRFTRVEAALTRLRDAGYLSGWRAPDAGLPHMPLPYRHARRFKITPKGEDVIRRADAARPAAERPLTPGDVRLLGFIPSVGASSRSLLDTLHRLDPKRRTVTFGELCDDLTRLVASGHLKRDFDPRRTPPLRYKLTPKGKAVLTTDPPETP